jgi:hypothetical protein
MTVGGRGGSPSRTGVSRLRFASLRMMVFYNIRFGARPAEALHYE